MRKSPSHSMFVLAVAGLLAPSMLAAQTPPPADERIVEAFETVLVDAIAGAEKSVVAIALVEPSNSDPLHVELRPGPFGYPTYGETTRPTQLDFQPIRYGTGVVIDRAGLILTAYHVLAPDYDYYVTLSDRTVRRARIRAADPRSDVAVLEMELTEHDRQTMVFSPIRLGDADRVKKGQIVLALGNPHAIAKDGQVSAAWGILSNRNRKLPPSPESASSSGKDTLHHFGTLLQTDAKLNLGTSGGPLLNRDGEMIGLVTSMAAVAGYESSAGYAFPVDDAFRRTVDLLVQGREIEYGFLGVQLGELTLAEKAQGKRGVVVEGVVRGLPGDRHGLHIGDIITAINGRPIDNSDELVLAISRMPLERTARLSVFRTTLVPYSEKSLDIDVPLAKYPVHGRIVATTPAADWRGVRVDYPSVLDDIGDWSRLGISSYDDGVLVTSVDEGSPAWNAGLREGVVVSRVQGEPVANPREFRNAVARANGVVTLGRIDPRDADGLVLHRVGR